MDLTTKVPALTPHGRLHLASSEGPLVLDAGTADRLEKAFERGAGYGLLQLGAGEVGKTLPPVFLYWREFAARYVTAVCSLADAESSFADVNIPPPVPEEMLSLVLTVPPMIGAEYLTMEVLGALWVEIDTAFRSELERAKATIQDFLKTFNPAWNLVGRVHFNIAENRKDESFPFAFLATYTHKLSEQAKAQHLPLGQAIREYAGAANKERLLSLLMPVQRAAGSCPWLKEMVDRSEIFHPLRWSPGEALKLINDIPVLESAGVIVRTPAGWRTNRPARPQVTATIGGKVPSLLGKDALLDFSMSVTLDGEKLTASEIKSLLAGTDGLVLVRGKWVEVDRARMQRLMEQFSRAEKVASESGMTFVEAMRMLTGANIGRDETTSRADGDWSNVTTGPWLAETLKALRTPEGLSKVEPGDALKASLRPYQQTGLKWLHFLSRLGLGACLADDMGLGKTMQVLSLLLVNGGRSETGKKPSLLLAPASLLANWSSEIERFAPGLKVVVAHQSATPAAELKSFDEDRMKDADLVMTSYGSLLRLHWLETIPWDMVIVDEAQAIKNPDAKQTRAVKRLRARSRIALTGTPVENRLSDLWSIFDFINPGLLGSAKEFTTYVKVVSGMPRNPYGPLRELVRPYILRRMKTDKSVIADLPDKTELKAYCQLSRKQAALYGQAVKELAVQLETSDGIKRKGVVLATLMKLKQICNHPSQWLGDGSWAEADSGKMARLRELAEVISAKQEKALVFTQFREMTTPIAAFLGSVFGRSGLVMHGETPIKDRKYLVQRFQEDELVPFFVLSLKVGGSGLNLTAASHVVHFDRWWNPAVENQATDRAFRIGQTKNVLVHKFVCRGTVEEKIDNLIESKRQLSNEILESGGEMLLTEMKDDELLKLVSLDLNTAMREG